MLLLRQPIPIALSVCLSVAMSAALCAKQSRAMHADRVFRSRIGIGILTDTIFDTPVGRP